jgi:hypothetical protein
MPLLHPAHVLKPGAVMATAGASGEVLAAVSSEATTPEALPLVRLGLAPAVSPAISARMGLEGHNEAGLTYLGRAVRLDARHAFEGPKTALSIGLGASAIMAQRPGQLDQDGSVYGGGADLPILFGVRTSADLFALWTGPRVGFDVLSGQLPDVGAEAGAAPVPFEAQHVRAGWVLGLRGGFRHLHVALELDAEYHYVTGKLGGVSRSLHGFTLTPGAGVNVSF